MATDLKGHPSADVKYAVGSAGLGDLAIAGNNAYNDRFNDNGKGSEGNGNDANNQVTTLDNFVRQNISGPLSEQVSDLTDFIAKHPLVKFLDSTIGEVFGGHPGQTYWESKAPPEGDPARVQYEIDNPRPVTDQFTYQMTPSEKNSQLPHAFIDGQPTTDVQKQIAALTGGRAPSSTVYSSPGVVDVQATAALANSEGNQSDNNNVTTLSNNTRLAGEEGRYTNSTPQRGSNTAAYDSNYNRAIPSTATLAANPFMTAQAAPLAGAITSPSAFNSVATSYGNTNNAGRQWTSGAMKTNNGGGYTNTAPAPLDTTENSTGLNDLYQEVFGRNVGQPGRDAYQSSLDNNSLSIDRLRAILYDSPEYKNAEKDNLAEIERNRLLAEQAKQARATEAASKAATEAASKAAAEAAAKNNATSTPLVVASPAPLSSSSGTGPDFRYTAEDGSVFSYDPSTNTPTLVTKPTATAPLADKATELDLLKERMNQSYINNFGRPIGDVGMDHYLPMLQNKMHTNGQAIDEAWFNSHLSKSGEAAKYTAKKAAAAAAPLSGAA